MEYIKITKPIARKMFRQGFSIFLLPCKVRKDNGFINFLEINSFISIDTFDRTVNEFEYYNCNAELGYYAHYYVAKKDLEKYKEVSENVYQSKWYSL